MAGKSNACLTPATGAPRSQALTRLSSTSACPRQMWACAPRRVARRASRAATAPPFDIRSRVAGRRGAAQDLCTALHYACCYGGHDHPAIAKARDAQRWQGVQEPSRSHAPASQKLIAHGADVHAKDCAGRTPLHYAAANGRVAQARLMRCKPRPLA